MPPKVSVVIPVYNVEKYLSRCVDSVIHQTYPNLEIILVNDGSIDASSEICDDYARKHNHINVIHQQNKGLSEARNTGLQNARGKYVYFLDSDDYIRNDAIEALLKKGEKENADIILFDAIVVNEKGEFSKDAKLAGRYKRKKAYPNTIAGIEMLRLMLQNRDYFCSACCLFIKQTFLREKKLSFYPGILHEDELFTFVALLSAERVSHIPEQLFFRRWRSNSIMTSNFTYRNVFGYCRAAWEMMDYCDTLQKAQWYIEIPSHILSLISSCADIYIGLDANERDNVRQDILAVFESAKKSTYMTRYCAYHHDFIENYRNAERVIFYGAGVKCASVLDIIQKTNQRFPDEIWDESASNIHSFMGIEPSAPNFKSLGHQEKCIMVVCIASPDVFAAVKQCCEQNHFNRVYGWWELYSMVIADL